ncbi:ankyrin repeat family protein [Rhynchospora pubera]|uniref:Ankyrin repeat family protein n=1 Tax=Rhynchospora pubera TaxID=906938 RepID=A0AAV8HYP2_9POAL|nr:ankyrin repeat family protein [Rhynchospora pubera]
MASSRASDERKATKLLEAASSGNLRVLKEVVKELNENQIKRIRNEIGLSALHLAAFHGRTEICQYFVQDLAFPVDFLTPLGETPLSQAAMCGHVATARYLISQGANTVAPNGEGSTPLHYAARYGQDELVKHLLSLGVPVDVTCNSAVGAPLITAALFGQASIVEVLLQHHADAGADLNLKCPLDMAIDKGLNDIIKCLLEAGADPNVRNAYEWLPIERAVMFSKWDIVEMLFPLTSPVPEVHDWSVHGILQYVQSNAFMEKYDAIQKKDLADLKVKGADSFKKKEYLNAFSYYSKEIKIDSGDAALFSNLSLCSY